MQSLNHGPSCAYLIRTFLVAECQSERHFATEKWLPEDNDTILNQFGVEFRTTGLCGTLIMAEIYL